MSSETPTLGEVIVHTKADWQQHGDVPHPYFIIAADGLFQHVRTAQGRGLVPFNKTPFTLKPTGYKQGFFQFLGDPIPASIYAQAVHFFRRIFQKHHTEAEVLITQHKDTKEYRLFVPTQSVSHGGVSSIYNPAHIHRDYLVVGTFHSHCDFGPGHSGIDEGDARDMDGIHGTIGYVTRDVPEMALMYAINGKFFHFTEPFEGVVDTTNLEAATAPEWWDRYVITTAVTDADRAKIAPYADDDEWAKFMRRYKKATQTKATVVPIHTTPRRYEPRGNWSPYDMYGYLFDPSTRSYRYVGSQPLRESVEFNRTNPRWDEEGALLPTESRSTDPWNYGDFWEDTLGNKYVDALFDTELLTETDIDHALASTDSNTPDYWERRMRSKLLRAVNWLNAQGLDVKVEIRDNRPLIVPGQTSLADHIEGVI